jgi:hypothetical protein
MKLKTVPTLAESSFFVMFAFILFNKQYSMQYVIWLTSLAVITLAYISKRNRDSLIYIFIIWQAFELAFQYSFFQKILTDTYKNTDTPMTITVSNNAYASIGVIRYLLAVLFTILLGRYLYKANFTLQNVERGTFPNPNKPINDNEKPFGEKEHFKYIKAITGTEEKESQYHRWIRKEYKDKLHAYIIDQNKLRRQMSISDSMTSKLFSDFVSGKTDFLNQEKYTGLIDIRNKSGGF